MIRRLYVRGLLASIVTAAVLGIVTPVAFSLVFGTSYGGGSRIALAMLPAGVLLSLMNISTTILWASGLPYHLLASDTIALITTVVLLLCLTPTLGVYGAVIASTAAYSTATSFAAAVIARRIRRKRLV